MHEDWKKVTPKRGVRKKLSGEQKKLRAKKKLQQSVTNDYASEMTYIVSGGALNSTHSLRLTTLQIATVGYSVTITIEVGTNGATTMCRMNFITI